MSIRRSGLLFLISLLFATVASAASSSVVISQVYGGGGNTSAPLRNDFIELFNHGPATVSLTGWSVQYAAAAGTTWQVTNLSGSLAPGHYYLVQEASGGAVGALLPTADATGTINMSATAGKVILSSSTTAFSGACPSSASMMDLVGFGTTANCFEGAGPTPAPSNTAAVLRASAGCVDAGTNNTDFAAGAPNPRNTSSPTNTCTTPGAPTSPSSISGSGTVLVSWTGNSLAAQYNVNRSTTSGSGYATVGSTGATSFTDSTVSNGTPYFYVVTAQNNGGESSNSSEVGATPLDPPGVSSITRGSANPTNAASVTFNVQFSQNVTGVDGSDFTLTFTGVSSPSITNVTGSGSSYTVTVGTGSGSGSIRLDVTDNDTIINANATPLGGSGAGNGSYSIGPSYTIDKTPPAVNSSIRAAASPTNAASVDFTVTFSENVLGVDAGDFAVTEAGVTGAAVTNVASINSATYTVTVSTGVGSGTLRLDFISDGSVLDVAGNATTANFVTGEVYSIDKIPPAVVSIIRAGTNPTSAASVDFTVTFTEPVFGVDASDFALTTTGITGATITGVSGSGSTYAVTAGTGTGTSGTIRLDIAASPTVSDVAGNALAGGYSGGEVYTVDRNAPAVTSVVRASANPTNAASVDFTVTFSQNVSGVDASDFALTATVSSPSVTNVAAVNGSTYTVTVNTGTGDGTIRLDVTNDGTIQSSTSIPLSGSFTSGEVYMVDKTAPTVQTVTRVGATPTNAASVQFTVTFSETVTDADSTDFALTTTGVSGATVTNVSGSGATYTVTVGTGSGDGDVRLDVANDGSIHDAAANALGATFTTGQSYTIDKTAPAVGSVARADADPSTAATVHFNVTFSESVIGVDSGDFAITAPSLTGTSITSVSGSGVAYSVTVATGSGNGTLRLDFVANGSVIDVAGNSAGSFFTGESYTMQGTPAAPTGLTPAAGNAHVALTWIAVSGASSYNVKRGTASGGPYTTIGSPAATNFDDLTAVNGTQYFYVVSAVGARGESPNSAQVSATPSSPAANTLGIIISQIYGGGGNSGAPYQNDYVELFNKGSQTVNVTNWSVQYQSSGGTTWAVSTITSGSIAPGHYFLVKEASQAAVGAPLPTADATPTTSINFSATTGKIALVNSTTALTCSSTATCFPGSAIADMIGYGTSTNAVAEGGAAAPGGSNTTSLFRANSGCTDTDNNGADFSAAAPNPRNSSSLPFSCSGFAASGSANPPSVNPGDAVAFSVTVTPGILPTSTGIAVTADLSSIGGSATQSFYDNGTNGDDVAGDNVFKFATAVSGGTTPSIKSIPVTATDAQSRSAGTTISLTVNPTTLSTIAQAKVDANADTIPDLLGQLVRVRGVVTSIDFRGGTGFEYYVQDSTAGVDIFNSTTDFGPYSIGANVEVIGQVAQFNGLTEIVPSSITTVSGLPAVTAQSITLSQLAGGVGEPLEGKLVTINGVTLATPPATWGANANFVINDSSGSGTIRIDSDTDIDGTPAPTGVFTLTGIVTQSDTSAPFDSGYQILPRALTDISLQTPPIGMGGATPSSVAPGGTTLLTVVVTPGQNPTSTGVTVKGNLSSIGGSATQPFFDDGTNGDVSPGDGTYSFNATIAPATTLGAKTIPFTVSDAQLRSTGGNVNVTVQSASAPPAPTGLVATAGNLQVSLTWNASSGASGYNIYRSTVSGGPYGITVATSVPTTSFTDHTVSNGTRYYYIVTATNGIESGPSNEATALPTTPPPSGSLAKVYFIDIGQGASTLIVSPTGKTLLVDGGPTGQGNAKVVPLLNTLGIATIDYTVLTHYHIDHDDGLAEVINAGKVAGTAYDNGDSPSLIPPNFSTSPTSTYGTYARYVNALSTHSGTITRLVATPGTVIDLGGGMRATIMAQGGHLLSGGQVTIDNSDLNTESVSVFVEYNHFDFLVSGDLTGGGSTDTAKTPDVETYVAQMVGDVDIVEFDHHGSTTANNRRFLKILRAEAAVAEAGFSNSFGHPNRETVNKYLNIAATSGNTYGGTGLPNPGNGPVSYQTDPSPSGDQRVTQQGYSGAGTSNVGRGTVLLKTDGTTSFTMESFDDGGARLSANAHVYALDATGAGVTTNFPPTVQPSISPVIPLATDTVSVNAIVADREDPIGSVTLNYAINGVAQAPATMSFSSGTYTATIAPQLDGTRVDYTVTAVAGEQSTSFSSGYFAGTTPISSLRVLDSNGEPLYFDYAARVQGVVTAGTGFFATGTNDDYLQDATGAINIWRTIQPSTPAVQSTVAGSIYSVAGLIGQNAGRLRLEVTPPFVSVTTPYQVTFISASSVPAPLVRTIAQINANPESLEGQLITINNCTITGGTIPSSPAAVDGFLNISDGTGAFQLKVDHNTDVPGMATPSGSFPITGILQQDDFLRPFDANYDIAPRNRIDLGGTSSSGPGLITIADARIDVDASGNTPGDYVPDRLNQTVHIRGVVTSVDFRGGNGIEYYIQDPTAGIDIFNTTINNSFSIGDNVDVIGAITQFNGLTEINPGTTASNLTFLAPGTLPPVTPQVMTCAQLGDNGGGEPFEGELLRINNVTIVSGTFAAGIDSNVVINDGTGNATLRIDKDTNVAGSTTPTGMFSVVGVLGQFDSAAPFDSGYQLFPRTTADILPPVLTPASITATGGTPQSAVVNTAFATQLAATVRDASSTLVSGASVTFTAPSSGASGTFAGGGTSVSVATNASGVATAPIFTANATAGSYNVTASVNSLTATFALTNLNPAATHFSVSAPANVTKGVAFNVTVTALDAANAIVTGYTGTVHFNSSSPGTLPADYTFVSGDSGAHTFSATLTTTGAQTIGVNDAANSLSGSASITVSAPPATHFSVNAPPTVTSGVPFSVTVTALEASNAIVSGYTGTVHFTSSSAGTLPADYTFASADAGTHSFSVTLTTTGAQTINAGDGSISGTANVTVTTPPPVTTHLTLTAPSSVIAGVPFTVTVKALDANNAIVTSYTGAVHFASSAAASLPPAYTFTSADAGSHTFSITLNANGPQKITVNDATSTASATITAACGNVLQVPVTAPAAVCASSTGNVASVATGASSYSWQITNGTITAGQGTSSITFTAGSTGDVLFGVEMTNTLGCTDRSAAGSSQIRPAPTARVPVSVHTCASVLISIPVTLTGTAPFTITWSDGVQQTNISGTATTRQFKTATTRSLQIVSVSDATCASGAGSTVFVVVDSPPVISHQPEDAKIHGGETATLVVAASPVVSYQWFQGTVGDESHPVGTEANFTTPPLRATTLYWVKATNRCDSTRSRQVTVTIVVAKRRAAGH